MKMTIGKRITYMIVGILFGLIMTKSEAISWYRIQEMFRFQSFHMYGIIGTAVIIGATFIYLIKRLRIKNINGFEIEFAPKAKTYIASIAGGTMFGLGWALTGACPGPLYVLIGNGYLIILVVISSALIGTIAYGKLRHKLPH